MIMATIDSTTTNDLQLLAVPQLMKKHFFIPDYQRGYRWEKDQIYQLLRDLWVYFNEATKDSIGFYCLQPIVVKACSQETVVKHNLDDLSGISPYDNPDDQKGPRNDVWYEVIDGQQRLTTIRILIAFHEEWNADDCSPYSLRYATRPELKDIFDNIIITRKPKAVNLNGDFKFNNIDVEYIKECAQYILDWFADDNEIEPGKSSKMASFLSNFYSLSTNKLSVQVIWYETKEATDARDIFERLNNLRVPLSSSELIRALFLSDNANYNFVPTDKQKRELEHHEIERIALEDKKKKQLNINAKWDEIEHFFHNDSFWAFITNRDTNDYRNRIELLFDFMSEKYDASKKEQKMKEQRLYTFTWFNGKSNDLWVLWNDVLKYYDTLRSWYEDKDSYHKIGYLINEKSDSVVIKLLHQANDKNEKHSFFRIVLDNLIRDTVSTTKKFSDLSYNDVRDYEKLKSLLFLYNVERTRKMDNEPWFPFYSYKKYDWTLEHIHAQNSECLDGNKRSEWLDWMTYTIAARESIFLHDSEESKRITALLEDLRATRISLQKDLENQTSKVKYDDVVELFRRDLDLWSGGKPTTIMHLLSNLALLSGDVNSGIGKGSFSVKQQYISHCLADGEKYIPICTKRVFLKYYYKKDDVNKDLLNQQMMVWDDKDRECYLDDIKTTLSTYFNPDKF